MKMKMMIIKHQNVLQVGRWSSARKIYSTKYLPRKEESSQIKTLSCYPKKLEKEEQYKLKPGRRI